jgi:signal transduction histidine kinase
MASAARAAGRGSVRRPLSVLVAANLLVLLAVGIGGIVGAVRAHSAVQFLTLKVEPAVDANFGAFQHLLDSETQIRGWAVSGDPALLDEYRAAVARFRVVTTRLERLSDADPRVALLVSDFMRAAETWLVSYAEPRLTEVAGPASFDAESFERGEALFADVREANAAVTAELGALSKRSRAGADDQLFDTIIVLSLVVVAGAALSLLVGSRAGRRVIEPLGALEETAHRLATGEHDARAPVSGPREVVQVATAINTMADENDRARAVEARVVDQLRALDSVKSDFVSNVSHELRTPLTSILGYLELLEEEMRDHAVDSELAMVAAAKRNVLRLGELIDDLLALTRSEAQHSELLPLDLATLTRDLVTDLRVASSQQGVEIRLGLPGTPVPVRADASQIARVVTNLVGNAVKFSQGAAEVGVTVVVDGNDAVLAVEDHGIGIPEAELDQVGSRFYRASNAVELGITGTGLGLRIVQAIIENHHGRVDLRSEQGRGTTIWVRLPLLAPDRVEPDDPELPDGFAGRAGSARRRG